MFCTSHSDIGRSPTNPRQEQKKAAIQKTLVNVAVAVVDAAVVVAVDVVGVLIGTGINEIVDFSFIISLIVKFRM